LSCEWDKMVAEVRDFCVFFTLVTVPRRSLSLKLSDTRRGAARARPESELRWDMMVAEVVPLSHTLSLSRSLALSLSLTHTLLTEPGNRV